MAITPQIMELANSFHSQFFPTINLDSPRRITAQVKSDEGIASKGAGTRFIWRRRVVKHPRGGAGKGVRYVKKNKKMKINPVLISHVDAKRPFLDYLFPVDFLEKERRPWTVTLWMGSPSSFPTTDKSFPMDHVHHLVGSFNKLTTASCPITARLCYL